MPNTWRDSAKPVIAKVLQATKGQDEKEIKKALHDAYPFGERRYWPYKVWCDEVRRQRGLSKKKSIVTPENQINLFGEGLRNG